MNKIHKYILLLCAVATFAGCASTTPKQAAGQSLATAAITVDAAMKGWGKWVKIQRTNPEADQAQLLRNEGKVRNAFDKYVASQTVAKDLYKTAMENPEAGLALFDLALLTLKDNETTLLNLITELTK